MASGAQYFKNILSSKTQVKMSSYQSPSKHTSFASRTAMSHTDFDATYNRFRPATDNDNRRLMGLGAVMQHGLRRCVIKKKVWDAHLASQQNMIEDGNESSDIDMPGFVDEPWVPEDLLVTGKDILLWAPLAKGGKGSRPAAKKRAKIRQNAHGGFCGLTKSWKIPFGIDPAVFAEGKAYAERKGMVASDTPRIYLRKVDWRGDSNVTIKNNFKKLGGSFDWNRSQWYVPGGAHLNGFEAYFSLFADQANVPDARPVLSAAAAAAPAPEMAPTPPPQAAASNLTAVTTPNATASFNNTAYVTAAAWANVTASSRRSGRKKQKTGKQQ